MVLTCIIFSKYIEGIFNNWDILQNITYLIVYQYNIFNVY